MLIEFILENTRTAKLQTEILNNKITIVDQKSSMNALITVSLLNRVHMFFRSSRGVVIETDIVDIVDTVDTVDIVISLI